MADEIALAVEACVQWHDAWMRAIGVDTELSADAWRTLAPPPAIYYGAIARRADARSDSFGRSFATVCDSWCTLDLGQFGFELHHGESWFVRAPGPLAEPPVDGLQIVQVTTPAEVETFEAVSLRGFAGEGPEVQPGKIHPTSILGEPRMTMWLGRANGEPVTAAMSYRDDDVVGIFGVTTIEPARGRGYAAALTRRAVLAETGLPAALNTNSPVAARIYEQLGFRRVGELRQWRPGPVTR